MKLLGNTRITHRIGLRIGAVALLLATLSFSASAEDSDALREAYAPVSHAISWESFTSVSPTIRNLVVNIAAQGEDFRPNGMPCFVGDVPADLVAYVSAAYHHGLEKYQVNSAWSVTATNSGGISELGETVLTYSFVPDGTIIPEDPDLMNGNQPSDLFSTFNGIFSAEANPTEAWQQLFHDIFQDWGDKVGITYVFEPNDDGAAFPESGVSNGTPGALGVRGDVRICGYNIDGDGAGILAFNFFPNSGDMVIDTTNVSFYSNSSNNYLGTRNTLSHEHGHGLGFSHSCPINNTKIMEPFISTAFDGPQLDDVLAGQLLYGDTLEPNGDAGAATALGAASETALTQDSVSISSSLDADVFSFTVAGTQDITIAVSPTGTTFLSGEQLGNGDCEAGTSFNSASLLNLDVQLLDGDGSTVLETANANGAGNGETISTSLSAGTYFVRVFTGDVNFDVQAYGLTVTGAATGPGDITMSVNPEYLQEGDLLSLTAPAGSAYQWFTEPGLVPVDSDGGRITGINSQTLVFTPALESDSGTYRVQYDNDAKVVLLSNPLTVTVLPGGTLPVAGGIGVLLLGSGLAAMGAAAMRRRSRK